MAVRVIMTLLTSTMTWQVEQAREASHAPAEDSVQGIVLICKLHK